VKAKRDTLPKTLELVREVLREPTFPQEEFDIFVRNRKQALDRAKTDPFSLAGLTLGRKVAPYPRDDIRYQPTIDESLARLEKLTRDQVVKLYQEQVGGNVGELVVVGEFDADATVKQVEGILAGWKTPVAYQRIATEGNEKIPGGREDILTPDKENAIYLAAFALRMQDTEQDYQALRLGNFILGGSASSRLLDRLRQKEGLSYGAGSFVQVSALDKNGIFAMQAICNPENIDKADKAALEELYKILKGGITKDELLIAKKGLLQELKVARGSDASLVGQLSNGLHLGRTMEYQAKEEKAIEALTLEEVNSALRTRLEPDRLIIIRAGDFNKKKDAPPKK